jgi:hypothetical protein
MTTLLARQRDAETPVDPSADVTTASSYADVVDVLVESFDGRLAPVTVLMTVRRCRRELDILAGPPSYLLVAMLARQRLTAMAIAVCPLPNRHDGICTHSSEETTKDHDHSKRSEHPCRPSAEDRPQ